MLLLMYKKSLNILGPIKPAGIYMCECEPVHKYSEYTFEWQEANA